MSSLFSLTDITLNAVFSLIAYILYWVSSAAGAFLGLCGTLFNIALQLTVHLDAFLQSSTVIYDVWGLVRDLASILLIFAILWASLQMILGLKQANYAGLIKSIIIAGILINFSFFFARIIIDFSNVISLQFFNAIAPTQDYKFSPGDNIGQIVSKSISNGSGGISGIFAGALHVEKLWTSKGEFTKATSGSEANQTLQVAISYFIAIIVQIVVGVSFLAAAIAAIYRTVALLFLLAFSAIWIAAEAVPNLKGFKDQWSDIFWQNIIFLPVYLMVMYVAVLFIDKAGLSTIVQNPNLYNGSTTAQWVSLFVAFVIILFVINLPLIAAIKFSGISLKAVKGISDWGQKWSKSAAIWPAGWAARNTIGAGAAAADKYLGSTRIGNRVSMQQLRAVTTGALAKNKFGTSANYVDVKKAKDESAKKRRDITRVVNSIQALDEAVSVDDYKKALEKLKGPDRAKLDVKYLKNPSVLMHLKKEDFENIKKNDDISDDDRKEISDARTKALEQAITFRDGSGKADKDGIKIVKHMLSNMDIDDIMKLDEGTKQDQVFISGLTADKLKQMIDRDLDPLTKDKIKDVIMNWHTDPWNPTGQKHQAFGYMKDARNKAWA